MAQTSSRSPLFWIVALIAAGTLLAGIAQLVAPRLVLGAIGGPVDDPAPYFFAIVGMFMAILGALTLHTLFSNGDHALVILWVAVQKLGAAAAVTLGVEHHTFGSLALLVAGFDLFSGILMLVYTRRLVSASVGVARA